MSKFFLLLSFLYCCCRIIISEEEVASPNEQLEFAFSCMNDSSIHFLEYYPHSGLANQLNELESALILAFLLNRTLIFPSILLGYYQDFAWKPFDGLNRTISHYRAQYKLKLNEMSDKPWTFLNVTDYFPDLSKLTSIRMISDDEFDTIKKNLNPIRYLLKDSIRYNFRFLASDTFINEPLLLINTSTSNTTIFYSLKNEYRDQKYPLSLTVGFHNSSLNTQRPSILTIGSLFGRNRIVNNFENEVNNQRFSSIDRALSLIMAKPSIPCFSFDKMYESSILKGKSYFSLHLRCNSAFSRNALSTTQSSLKIFFHNVSILHALETCLNDKMLTPSACDTYFKTLTSKNYLSENIPLYVATDMENFTQSKDYSLLSKHFKTILTLDDVINPTMKQAINTCLKNRKNDSSIPITLLFPLFDQMIASRSHLFVGTKKSTFSADIHRMHLLYMESTLSKSNT